MRKHTIFLLTATIAALAITACEKYGRLYTFEEAMKACPERWKLPSREEWDNLFKSVFTTLNLREMKLNDD